MCALTSGESEIKPEIPLSSGCANVCLRVPLPALPMCRVPPRIRRFSLFPSLRLLAFAGLVYSAAAQPGTGGLHALYLLLDDPEVMTFALEEFLRAYAPD